MLGAKQARIVAYRTLTSGHAQPVKATEKVQFHAGLIALGPGVVACGMWNTVPA